MTTHERAGKTAQIALKAKVIAHAWPDLNEAGRAEVIRGIAALPSRGAAYVAAYVADHLHEGHRAGFVKALAAEIFPS